MFISILKYSENLIPVTKDNYDFNITETITIESIDTILENQILKKTEFELKKSNLVVKKQKIQQLSVKYVTSNKKQIDLDKQISKTKTKIEKLITIAKIIKQRNSLK